MLRGQSAPSAVKGQKTNSVHQLLPQLTLPSSKPFGPDRLAKVVDSSSDHHFHHHKRQAPHKHSHLCNWGLPNWFPSTTAINRISARTCAQVGLTALSFAPTHQHWTQAHTHTHLKSWFNLHFAFRLLLPPPLTPPSFDYLLGGHN